MTASKFFMWCCACAVAFVIIALGFMGMAGQYEPPLAEESYETDDYVISIFRNVPGKSELLFMSGVLDYALTHDVYDVTFTKGAALVAKIKLEVYTQRRPEVVFGYDEGGWNSAVVWWWKGMRKFPEEIKEGKKKKK